MPFKLPRVPWPEQHGGERGAVQPHRHLPARPARLHHPVRLHAGAGGLRVRGAGAERQRSTPRKVEYTYTS